MKGDFHEWLYHSMWFEGSYKFLLQLQQLLWMHSASKCKPCPHMKDCVADAYDNDRLSALLMPQWSIVLRGFSLSSSPNRKSVHFNETIVAALDM